MAGTRNEHQTSPHRDVLELGTLALGSSAAGQPTRLRTVYQVVGSIAPRVVCLEAQKPAQHRAALPDVQDALEEARVVGALVGEVAEGILVGARLTTFGELELGQLEEIMEQLPEVGPTL